MKTKFTTLEITKMGMFVALISICSMILIPLPMVSFTMQTFAVYLCLLMLGGKMATMVVGTYLLLGGFGLPIFAGMKGGFGVLFGSTGGYLLGFIGTTLLYWGLTKVVGERKMVKLVALVLGTFLCYSLGTMWFITVYNGSNESAIGISQALAWCVTPFIIPDLVKIYLACVVETKVTKATNQTNYEEVAENSI